MHTIVIFAGRKVFERTASQIGWIVKTFNVQQKKNRKKKEKKSTQGGHRLGSVLDVINKYQKLSKLFPVSTKRTNFHTKAPNRIM